MADAEMYIISTDGDGCTVSKRYSDSHEEPQEDDDDESNIETTGFQVKPVEDHPGPGFLCEFEIERGFDGELEDLIWAWGKGDVSEGHMDGLD
jgi:hypothetical protein